MKILNLTTDSKIYTSNVYLITGTWNAFGDVNTLIDVGRDPSVIEKINNIPTGVGKHKIDQVILTHSHYDHTGLLPQIKKAFNPVIYAFSASLEGVDCRLKDKETLKIGDRIFEVHHTPGHSIDSICLYCDKEGVLFSGDTPIFIKTPGGTYETGFVRAMEKLCCKNIQSIYCGHGKPLQGNLKKTLYTSLNNARKGLKK
ncbi:MAG: MBL fold metallo-hydrolase [Desulfobacterales bacterium]|nr:MBL fold metallo-hydrolase [Desulfobacterales bacterium]